MVKAKRDLPQSCPHFFFNRDGRRKKLGASLRPFRIRNGLENAEHIFISCFGRVSCPSCHKIQGDGAGYPHLGLKGLGACQPEDECDRWPGDYAVAYALGDIQTAARQNDIKAQGPTVIDALALLLEHEVEAVTDPKFDKWGWEAKK